MWGGEMGLGRTEGEACRKFRKCAELQNRENLFQSVFWGMTLASHLLRTPLPNCGIRVSTLNCLFIFDLCPRKSIRLRVLKQPLYCYFCFFSFYYWQYWNHFFHVGHWCMFSLIYMCFGVAFMNLSFSLWPFRSNGTRQKVFNGKPISP